MICPLLLPEFLLLLQLLLLLLLLILILNTQPPSTPHIFSPPPFFPSMKSFFAQPYKIFSVRNFRGNCDAKKEDKDMTKT